MDNRKLRAGIVGGGRGAFIGSVHRIAAEMDNQADVIAGAMSSDPKNAEESARDWHLTRSYASFEDMAKKEKSLTDGIDFVMIATPNHMHYPVIKAFAGQGIHIVCDKPLSFSVEEAEEIGSLVEKNKIVFALTHINTGYPLVREAREIVRGGKIGDVRKVIVEYLQDWLSNPIEKEGQKQAAWRTDPSKSGISCCIGDIGTHGENLLEYITGIRIKSVCADLTTFVSGRPLEDDANILLRLENGGKGFLTCSQIATGEENNLWIRIYGTKASIEWHQQEPNTLTVKYASAPVQVLRTNRPYLTKQALAACRIPCGHPEGYLEGFANIYRGAIADIRALKDNKPLSKNYPSVHDGIRGMKFVKQCVESHTRGNVWMEC